MYIFAEATGQRQREKLREVRASSQLRFTSRPAYAPSQRKLRNKKGVTRNRRPPKSTRIIEELHKRYKKRVTRIAEESHKRIKDKVTRRDP